MGTLNKNIKEITKMVPASELNLIDIGGYWMNRARWTNKGKRECVCRKNEENISLIIRGRNRAGQAVRDYKTVKQKEL